MTKPYKEGAVWSIRLRLKGEQIYRTGFASDTAARKEVDKLRHTIKNAGKAALNGPWRSTVAQALKDFALERLPTLKGAKQDACRINRYLRAAGLATLRLKPAEVDVDAKKNATLLWQVEEVPARLRSKIPQGLAAHRHSQAKRTEQSDKQRQKLAHTLVAEVTSYDLQKLVDTMGQDGYGPATVSLERAMLRRLFNYAKQSWNWPEPSKNPAVGLILLAIDNERDRVMSNKEWRDISKALTTCDNVYVAPAVALLLQTAMRSSEALVGATWGDVDRERCVLRLREAKAGWRDVPLNPAALEILGHLQTLAQARGDDVFLSAARILPLSYESLKAAWNRVCARAGVVGIKLHDLRHTSATRFALEYHGNIAVLKVITGHKTVSQLMRYVNIKVDDVARLMHGRPLDHDNAPAGMLVVRAELVRPLPGSPAMCLEDLPANVVSLTRRIRAV